MIIFILRLKLMHLMNEANQVIFFVFLECVLALPQHLISTYNHNMLIYIWGRSAVYSRGPLPCWVKKMPVNTSCKGNWFIQQLFRPLSSQSFSSQLSPSPSLSFSLFSLTFTQSLQSYWPWFLLICIHHFSFFGIWRWGTFPSLSEFTAISLCVFSKGLGYEMHIKYPLIPHYPTDKITMIMRQKF